MSDRPNILFLLADQLQAFCLGCMGHAAVSTPHLDALAADGVLMRNAYSNSPTCTPFRGCLFTGRYPRQSGVLRNEDGLPGGVATLAEALAAGGHRTGYVGKWHLGATANIAVDPGMRRGFHDFLGYQAYNDYLDQVWFFDEAGGRRDCGERHRTDATTDLALERIAAWGDAPAALFVSYQNPHYPLQPSPAFEAMYAGVDLPERANARPVAPYTPTWSPRSAQPVERDPNYQKYGRSMMAYRRLYCAMVTQLDWNIGRLLRLLKGRGLYERTAIVFTSDHGDLQGSHGLINKSQPWEESARIPLIARVPGGARGTVADAAVSAVDFMPTLLDLVGLEAPADLAGASFAAALRGAPAVQERPVFAEDGSWLMIREGRYKLVADRDLAVRGLYDLESDPCELRDLVADLPGERGRLRAELARWDERMGARSAAARSG